MPPRARIAEAIDVPEIEDPVAAADSYPIAPELEEFLQQQKLEEGTGDIYGIPREEWLKLTAPVRYMGNEFGAVHKPFAEQVCNRAPNARRLTAAVLDLASAADVVAPHRARCHVSDAAHMAKHPNFGAARQQKRRLEYCSTSTAVMHVALAMQDVRFTLTYPESYEVGSSNLGHIILYTILNQTEGAPRSNTSCCAPSSTRLNARLAPTHHSVSSTRLKVRLAPTHLHAEAGQSLTSYMKGVDSSRNAANVTSSALVTLTSLPNCGSQLLSLSLSTAPLEPCWRCRRGVLA